MVSDSLQSHGLQHSRIPCPSLSPRVCSDSCLLSQWCYPTISPSLVPFSSCPQSFPASGSFPMSWLFPSDGCPLYTLNKKKNSVWLLKMKFIIPVSESVHFKRMDYMVCELHLNKAALKQEVERRRSPDVHFGCTSDILTGLSPMLATFQLCIFAGWLSSG